MMGWDYCYQNPTQPQGLLHPAHSPGPCVSPQGHQPWPQWCCTRAGLQLPTALSCPAVGLLSQACPWCHIMAWPQPIPSPGRCPMPRAGAALVPAGCPALGWGSGMAPSAGPCPATLGDSSLLPVPREPPAPGVTWWLFLLLPEERWTLVRSDSSVLGLCFGGGGRNLHRYLGTDSWLRQHWSWPCCLLWQWVRWLRYP